MSSQKSDVNLGSTLKCLSCGLPLDAEDMNEIAKLGEEQNLKELCRACSLNYTHLPSFKSIVLGMANGYFIQKMGLKNQTTAIKSAWDIITKLPYWQAHLNDWIPPDILNSKQDYNFAELQMTAHIFEKMSEAENIGSVKERPDIFISYSWNGPYVEFVAELVTHLKNRGYIVWYDKEEGLKPGELEKYLKDAILESKNCIPIICKEYFTGDYTKYELEMLFKTKDKKHIIPVWWSDMDSQFIKGQGFCGEQILNSAGITWKNCNCDMETLINQLDAYLTTIEEKETYNGVKLYESEAQFMKELERVVGMAGQGIPVLDISNSGSSRLSQEFGFSHQDGHVTELVLRKMTDGRTIPSLNLPNSFRKLKKIQKLDAPLVKIPKGISDLKELRVLHIHDGMLEVLPDELGILDLTKLEINLMGNPHISKVEEKSYTVLEWMMKKMNLYRDLPRTEAINPFLIQLQMGLNDAIPRVEKVEWNTFGYTVQNGSITAFGLHQKKLTSLPETIGSLQSLTELVLVSNKLTSLPESIGNLKSLTKLDLEFNKLTSLPETIGNLKSLKKLDLVSNKLTSLPERIEKVLKKLKDQGCSVLR